MQYGASSDVGKKRKINEDSYYIETETENPYIIVADGMGGHMAGEVASRMAVDIISNHIAKYLVEGLDYVEAAEVIRRAFLSANTIIYDYSAQHYKVMGMGTTATLSMIYGEKLLTVHVGDSRSYAVSGDKIRQITRDHSYVQELVAMGRLTPQEAKNSPNRNFITRAMGAEEKVKPDVFIEPYSGEKLLLCSDGLTNFVEDEELLEILNKDNDLQRAADAMIALANERGGLDNITAAVMAR